MNADLFKSLILAQYEAALRTIQECVEQCPDKAWDRPVANHAFCQAVFHTVFFTDVYLGENLESVQEQVFHREHAAAFEGYEQLIDKKPERLYEKAFIRAYLEHCLRKARDVTVAETAESLAARTGFEWHSFIRAELHVYNIRHIQHHAAQLSLRLRLDHEGDIPWFKSGWAP